MHYQVKLEEYEGPLDLLLRLVEREEIAASTVSVRQIIDQFLAYLTEIDYANLDEGSRFLVLAATLLAVKAQLLLPRPEGDHLQQSPVVDDLEVDYGVLLQDYLEFRQVAVVLDQRAREWQLHCKRHPEPLATPAPLVQRDDLSRLVKALQGVLSRQVIPDPYEVQRAPVNIWEVMASVEERLSQQPAGILFAALFPQAALKEEIIVTFMALLELVYRGQVRVRQDDNGAILMQPVNA